MVDALGNPLRFLLSPGHDHHATHAVDLLTQAGIGGSNVLGDKAKDTHQVLQHIAKEDASSTILPKRNARNPWPVDWSFYKEQHLVECFFQKIKWFRRIATRYDNQDQSFLAFVFLASIKILLQ